MTKNRLEEIHRYVFEARRQTHVIANTHVNDFPQEDKEVAQGLMMELLALMEHCQAAELKLRQAYPGVI